MPNREITFYYNSLTYMLANLKNKQRAFTTEGVDSNNETVWGSGKGTKGWLAYKDLDGDLQVPAIQKYYDDSLSAWVRRGNVFADIEVDEIYSDTGFKDQYLAADLPISESGVTALDGGFTATSIVGAINELKSGITAADTYWAAQSGTSTKPKSPFIWIYALSGFQDQYCAGIPLAETGDGSLDGGFTATSIIGALNEIKSGGTCLWTLNVADIYFNTGNVGIGNSSPTFRVDIAGTDITSSSNADSRFSANAGGSTLLFQKSRHATIGSHTIVQDNDDLGTILFRGSDGTDFGTVSAQIQAQVDDASPAASSIGGCLIFSTAPGLAIDDLAERIRITAAGNVGIGTDSPNVRLGQRLDIVKSGSPGGMALTTYSTVSAEAPILDFKKSNTLTIGNYDLVPDGALLGSVQFRGADGAQFVDAATIQIKVDGVASASDMPGKIEFATTADGASSSTVHLTIRADGKTGFGVTDPDAKVEILSTTIQLKLSYNATESGSIWANVDGDVSIRPSGDNVILPTGKHLQFGNARQAGDPTTDGYIIIKDSTGTQYKIPCLAV